MNSPRILHFGRRRLTHDIRKILTVGSSTSDGSLSGSLCGTSKYTGNENEAILRIVSYSLPEALHANVHTVALTTLFAYLHPPLQMSRKRSSEEATELGNTTSWELEVPATSKVPAFKRSDCAARLHTGRRPTCLLRQGLRTRLGS